VNAIVASPKECRKITTMRRNHPEKKPQYHRMVSDVLHPEAGGLQSAVWL